MKNILKELGLNGTETDVYLALLPVGQASASIIAYHSGYDRSTVRYACNKLVKKGLLKSEKKAGKTLYFPESPFKLLFLLEEDKRRLQKKEDMIHRVIVELNAVIDPSSTLPKVRCYDGLKEIKASYDQLLENSKEKKIYTTFFSDGAVSAQLYNYFMEEYMPKRVENGIHSRHITLDSPKNREEQEQDEALLREMRFLSQERMPKLDAAIHMSDDMVHYMGFTDSNIFALVIENKKISDMFRSVFEILWSISSK